MTEFGTVVFISESGAALVVKHPNGYALLALGGGHNTIDPGDRVNADWTTVGAGEFKKDGVTLQAVFRGNWTSPLEPVELSRQILS